MLNQALGKTQGQRLRASSKSCSTIKNVLLDVHRDRVSLRPPPPTNRGLKLYLMLHLLLV
jgi:hypothetical protein